MYVMSLNNIGILRPQLLRCFKSGVTSVDFRYVHYTDVYRSIKLEN